MFSSLKNAVPSLWKDEAAGKSIVEAVCLKSKVYLLRVEGQRPIKRCKGIGRSSMATLNIEEYRSCVQSVRVLETLTRRIAARNFKLSTLESKKRSLTSFDDKRYLFDCGVHSWPYSETVPPTCPYC